MQPRPDRRVFWLLERASAGMRQRIERLALERLETTAAQLPVIFHLASRAGEKGCRPGELAEALGVNAAAVTGLTGRMEAAGVLRRKPAPDDGRAQLLSLTAAGRRIAERALPEVARLQAELLEGFSAEEIETVTRFLRSVSARAPALGEPSGERGRPAASSEPGASSSSRDPSIAASPAASTNPSIVASPVSSPHSSIAASADRSSHPSPSRRTK